MTSQNPTSLCLVVPCYNEEAILPASAQHFRVALQQLIDAGAASRDSTICFIDDGSSDRTWALIEELSVADSLFTGIQLTRNYGHQHALYAGLMATRYGGGR